MEIAEISFDIVGRVTMEIDVESLNLDPETLKNKIENGEFVLNLSDKTIHSLPTFEVVAKDGSLEFDAEYIDYEVREIEE